MDDLSVITLGPTDPSIKPNTFPDAHIVWEPNADRTHANGHLVWRNGGDTPELEPEREDITVFHATAWAHHNNYLKGQTVYCNLAHFSGGSAKTIYRWRLQKRADADSGWVNYSWNSYTNHSLEINITCPDGQVRIQCQARDDSVDPMDQVNSFSTIETVTTPVIAPITSTANGQPYDPSNQTLEGVAGQELVLMVETAATDLINLDYTWTVRSGQARLSGSGNARVALLQSTETELVGVQVDIVDPLESASDTPQSVRFNIMTRA